MKNHRLFFHFVLFKSVEMCYNEKKGEEERYESLLLLYGLSTPSFCLFS